MICKQCKKFFSISPEESSTETTCPHCDSTLAVSRAPVGCRCEHCRQKLEIEEWMEGETTPCPDCGKDTVLRRLPPVDPPPRFRMPAAPREKAASPAEGSSTDCPAVAVEDKSSPSSLPQCRIPLSPGQQAAAKELADRLTAPVEPAEPPPRSAFGKVHRKQLLLLSSGIGMILLLLLLIAGFNSCQSAVKYKLPHIRTYVANGQLESLKTLLDATPVPQRRQLSQAALAESLRQKKQRELALLLEHGFIRPDQQYGKVSLLDLAAADSNDWLLDALILGKTDLNLRLGNGSVLLGEALRTRNHARLKRLLDNGADANSGDALGVPVIFQAINDLETLELLVEHGAKLNVRDWALNTPLLAALNAGNDDIALFLLSRKVSAAVENSNGDTPLIVFLRNNPHLEKDKNKNLLLSQILQRPCKPNTVNLLNESAMSLLLAQKQYALLPRLLKAGALPPEQLSEQLPPKLKNLAALQAQLDSLKSSPVKELIEEEPIPDESTPPYSNGKPLFFWFYLIFWFFWIACGLAAVRFLPQGNDRWAGHLLNMLALPSGPLLPLGYGLFKLYARLRDRLRKQRHREEALEPHLRFFAPSGEECGLQPSPESAVSFNLCRAIFSQALQRHCSGILLTPSGNGYQVILKESKQDTVFLSPDLSSGRALIAILKNIAGLNCYEEVNPQNGHFILQKEHQRSRVLISTVGLGTLGERALLTFREAVAEIHHFRQLILPPGGQRAIESVCAEAHGLILVAGAAGSGRRTFVSLLLEEFSRRFGNTVWLGNGDEPTGSDSVPRLKADLTSGVTPENLLAALPDCRAAAITLERNDPASIHFAFRQAERKIVVLLTDCHSGSDAIRLCRTSGIPDSMLNKTLKLTVTPYLLHALCHCAEPATPTPEMLQEFRQYAIPTDQLRNPGGCIECAKTGVSHPIVIYDVILPEQSTETGSQPGGIAGFTACLLAARGVVAPSEVKTVFNTYGDR